MLGGTLVEGLLLNDVQVPLGQLVTRSIHNVQIWAEHALVLNAFDWLDGAALLASCSGLLVDRFVGAGLLLRKEGAGLRFSVRAGVIVSNCLFLL